MSADYQNRIGAGLRRLIGHHHPDAGEIRIGSLEQLHGGLSSEIWAFTGEWRNATGEISLPLILRRAARQEFRSAGRAAEFQLLRSLERTDIPAPRAYWVDETGAFLGRPAMILERAQGAADRHLLTDTAATLRSLSLRVHLAQEIADLLGRLHRIDVGTLDLSPSMRAGPDPAGDQLSCYDAEIACQALEPLPELRLVALWLREHLPPPPAQRVLVHGDFRPANILVADDRVTALLDWEFAHEGDASEDLGWYLASCYADDHLIPGAWSAADFLARYASVTGHKADPSAICFWSVFALYKLTSMALTALRAGAEGDAGRMIATMEEFIDALLAEVAI